jgi:hypothetical protein
MDKTRNEHAAALGALGGQATMRKLSAARRSEIASEAGKAAWKGYSKKERSAIMRSRAKRRAEKATV